MGDQAAAYRFAHNLPARSIGGTKVTDLQHVHLSYGFPATDLLPVEELQAAAAEALKWDRADALHYSGAKGPARVRDWVLARSRKFGIHAGAENFIPTFGAIQGIDLTARILLNPGDEAWVEAPTFFNGLQAFRAAGAVIKPIPVDEQGLQVELLEAALKQAAERNEPIPKLLYCMPNYHNPTGVSLSLERRKRLAELAVTYNFLILEDDAYAELNISGETLPAIYSFAPEQVIYVSTFSKTLGPGLRLGWAIAAPEVISHMATLSLGSQLNPFTQEVVGELLQHYGFDEQVEKLTERYRAQRDTMIRALKREFAEHIAVQAPAGGFFVWVTFDEQVDVRQFAPAALAKGVSFVAGNAFFADGEGSHHLRLCFSFCNAEQIERGIKALAEAYFEALEGQAAQQAVPELQA